MVSERESKQEKWFKLFRNRKSGLERPLFFAALCNHISSLVPFPLSSEEEKEVREKFREEMNEYQEKISQDDFMMSSFIIPIISTATLRKLSLEKDTSVEKLLEIIKSDKEIMKEVVENAKERALREIREEEERRLFNS